MASKANHDRLNVGRSQNPAPLDDGAAAHLEGLSVPPVELGATTGGPVTLATLKGRSIVYCYTWTGRPGVADPPDWDNIAGAHGSTPQSEAFRDHYDDFSALGVEVYGLSVQDSDYQCEMAARLKLPFKVFSDAALEFARALNLPTFETGGVIYLKRLTLVIEDGRIVRTVYPVHPPEDNARDLLSWLRKARQRPV